MRKFSKFTYSGMSFKDYVGKVKKNKSVKVEMKQLV